MNVYLNSKTIFQKMVHVSKAKLTAIYGSDADCEEMREYTTLVFYNKQTKIARFEVAIVYPNLDRFSRKGGREEVLKKLASETPFMLMDLNQLVKNLTPKAETCIVSHLLSDFTHEIIPRFLFGKRNL